MTTARIAPASANAAAAIELTARPASSSRAATTLPFRNTCEMLCSAPCTKSPAARRVAASGSNGATTPAAGSAEPARPANP